MTTTPIDTDEQHARLDRMRAEFSAARQRRDETRRQAPVADVCGSEPTPALEAEPPPLATGPDITDTSVSRCHDADR